MDYFENSLAAAAAVLGTRGLAILGALVILIVGWTIAGWLGRGVTRAAQRHPRIDATLAPLLAKVVRIAMLVVTVIMALDAVGVDTTSVVAFLGAMGVAIGLALKDTISDLASGIVLLVLRPFDVADFVDISGIAGTVTAIDLFETRLTNPEGVPIVLPNSKVRGNPILNFSRAAERRVDLVVAIAYEAEVDRALEIVRAVLDRDERIKREPAPLLKVNELADSSVKLLVRFWTAPDQMFDTKLDTTRALKLALDEAGIEIPYPKRTLIMDGGPKAA